MGLKMKGVQLVICSECSCRYYVEFNNDHNEECPACAKIEAEKVLKNKLQKIEELERKVEILELELNTLETNALKRMDKLQGKIEHLKAMLLPVD